MSWGAVAAATIGAGGGIIAANQSGGSSGEGGSISPTNPAFFDLLDVFGKRLGEGGIKNRRKDPSAFVGLEDAIKALFESLPLSQLEQLAPQLGLSAFQDAPRSFESIESALAAAEELVQTGFRTNIDDFLPQAERQLEDFRAQTIEDFGSNNILRSVPFAAAFDRNATRLTEDLTARQVGLDESAANRQAGGIPLQALLATTRTAFPINLANDLSALGRQDRFAQEQIRPEQRMVDLFSQFSQLGSGQQFFQQGFNPQNGLGDILGTLANAVGPLINALGSGGGGGGGGSLGAGGIGGTGAGFNPLAFG